MMWQELTVKVPSEYVEPIWYLFGRYGRGVSVEDTGGGHMLLRTYLPNTSRARRARIEIGVNLVRSIEPMANLEVRTLEEADWENAWKAHFSVLKVGRRMVIKPSWLSYRPAEGDIVIELDPGMAFGTGYHPTTRMCMEALERWVSPSAQVLDLGTGSAILSMTAAALGAARIVALDVDPTAVRAARKNIKGAGLKNSVRLVRGSLPHPEAVPGSFQIAVANISAKTVRERAPHLYATLDREGLLITSGFVDDQATDLKAYLVQMGFEPVEDIAIDDWVALVMRRTG